MAELPKEELVKIAHANQHLAGIAIKLVHASDVGDEVAASQIRTLVDAMLDEIAQISSSVLTAR